MERNFIYQNDIKVSYYRNGETKLKMQKESVVPNPSLRMKTNVTIPPCTLAILTARGTVNCDHTGQLFKNKLMQTYRINIKTYIWSLWSTE